MNFGFTGLVVVGVYSLLYVVPVVYFLVIVTRLVNAVERIAKRQESTQEAIERSQGRERA